jgi:putative hydrolase of the HAD superfamily
LNFSSVKNIIFDLGGVIINIDFQYTFEAFAKLGDSDILSTLKKFKDLKVFERYEAGEFTDPQFRNFLRNEFSQKATDQEIDQAWNALLKDIPIARIQKIQQLKEKYNLYLLSNTNHIHIQEVNNILHQTSGIRNLNLLFDKVYLSYEMKMSKPHLEIYNFVLEEQKLNGSETVFIDDNKDNIIGAQNAGLQTIHVEAPHTILELLAHA